ncbi:MAG TPA: ATPase domain-containing protein [Vicinamibacterales bacterium]
MPTKPSVVTAAQRSKPLVSTGIAGLDQLLTGGLTPNRLYLIEGRPGTGKTTLGLHFLLEGLRQSERCLYVTLAETASELRAIAESHGWSLEGIQVFQMPTDTGAKSEDQYTLYHPSEVELGETMEAVLDRVDELRPTRIVFDSLSEMRLLARDPLRYRRQILDLKGHFAERECTALLLDDHSAGDADLQLESLSHGVILLEQLPYEYGRTRRRLRVVKMRGVATIEGFHDFSLRRGGLTVYPQLLFDSTAKGNSGLLESGLPELDELLGGGIEAGTSTLVLGPAGSGKSTLCAQYATLERAKTAIYLFEERRKTYLARCDALGMRLSELQTSGQVLIEQIEAGSVSPGEFSYRIKRAVEEEGVTIVLIDSLNGYLNAIPQVSEPLARMHELVSYLNERGVATLMVVAQHGVIGSMEAPLDISYLSDCVVMLRFFEAGGAVRRAISVVKKRSGPHESTIRELRVGPNRLHVGKTLADFDGVLTGNPRYHGAAGPLLFNGHDAG